MRTIKSLFNPNGSSKVEDVRIVRGNHTAIMDFNNVKYHWAISLWEVMRGNNWYAEKINFTIDKNDYQKLTQPERRAYKGILSFLVFLDSINTYNPTLISMNITAPEVNILFALQAFQEAVHSQTYGVMIDAIIPADERPQVYEYWRSDPILLKRIEYIAKDFEEFAHNPTDENLVKAIIAMYLLEGLYFYNGFIYFYLLSSRGVMNGSADAFKLINRDEVTHITLVANVINEIRKEFPDLVDDNYIIDKAKTVAELEIEWINHIIGDDILGITKKTTEEYTKYLVNKRLKKIKIDPIFPDNIDTNPYRTLEQIADTGSENNTRTGFFERTNSKYNMAGAVKGWDSAFEDIDRDRERK